MTTSFALRMTKQGDDTEVPYDPISPERAIEIVQDIFKYEESIRYIEAKQMGDILHVVVVTDLDNIDKRLTEIFGWEAGDTWMEGDISIDDNHDLNLILEGDIKQLVTPIMLQQASLDQLNNILESQGLTRQSNVNAARLQVFEIYRAAQMLYPEAW